MAFSEFSRADEIEAARSRTFTSMHWDERDAQAIEPLVMRDPQQPDAANLVMPEGDRARGRNATTLVEPMVYTAFERIAPIVDVPVDAADQVSAPDPHEVARELVADARATARTMLAQARDVIAAERAQAVQQGYAEGFAQGQAEADTETAGLIRTCEDIGIHVMRERERVLAENEADVVELAISIARRIVNAAIDVDETLVVEACRGAMRKAFQRGSMQVLAHPADLELLREAGPQLAQELGGVEHLDFVEERRLDRGSVIVRTPAGEIDATVAGKADRIEQTLREGIEQRRAERRAAS